MRFYKIDAQIALSEAIELVANTTDGTHEKHVPMITVTPGNTVLLFLRFVE